MRAWVYILECSDGRYYVGSHRGEDVGVRVDEHNAGIRPKAYTYSRRPVTLMWADYFGTAEQAVQFERKLKGWTHAKKTAFIRGEWRKLSELAKNRSDGRKPASPSTGSG